MTKRENEIRENNQSQNKEGASNNFIVGALVGGAMGAAAALLLAPKTGKELRIALANQVNNFLEKTNQLSGDVAEKSNELAAMTKEKTASFSKAVVLQSKELVNIAKNLSQNEENPQEDSETRYISLKDFVKKKNGKKDADELPENKEIDIRKKLEEAKKAFDEEENKIKH